MLLNEESCWFLCNLDLHFFSVVVLILGIFMA